MQLLVWPANLQKYDKGVFVAKFVLYCDKDEIRVHFLHHIVHLVSGNNYGHYS
jgi:hypothetical protein